MSDKISGVGCVSYSPQGLVARAPLPSDGRAALLRQALTENERLTQERDAAKAELTALRGRLAAVVSDHSERLDRGSDGSMAWDILADLRAALRDGPTASVACVVGWDTASDPDQCIAAMSKGRCELEAGHEGEHRTRNGEYAWAGGGNGE